MAPTKLSPAPMALTTLIGKVGILDDRDRFLHLTGMTGHDAGMTYKQRVMLRIFP